jgi:sterol desaturase/sphingolipid hydroxylase (fatty acid hydroxylase superfamily)
LLIVAGGLQLYFHTFKKQGQQRKYEARPQATNNPRFMFRDQVKDNMFWTLTSGLFFWSTYQVLYFWAWANGYAPWASLIENPIWFVLWLPLISLWSSFQFYWVHRWLHWPPLFKRVHSLHHRMTNVGPWSGIAMHPVEHLMYFSSILIHFIVPSSPIHVLYHFYLQGVNPAVTHSGYECVEVNGKSVFDTGNFFHQLHHRYYNCNYGTSELPLDRWFGSHHDGTHECTATIRSKLGK